MDDPGVGRQYLFMAGTGLVYFLIVLLIEHGFVKRPEIRPRAYDDQNEVGIKRRKKKKKEK